jgi:hypothetical protein
MWLKFGSVIFWRKDFSAKAAHKILVKLPLDHLIIPNLNIQKLTYEAKKL